VAGEYFCRRHATIMRPLGAIADSHLPNVDNRAPALTQWIADRIDEPITRLLEICRRDDETFSAEPLGFVFAARDGLHRWERSWKLVSHIGVSLKVVVEADEERDGLVCVRVGQSVATRVVPPWIDRRAEGDEVSPDFAGTERELFYAGMVDQLRVCLMGYLARTGAEVPAALTKPLTFKVPDQPSEKSWLRQFMPKDRRAVNPAAGHA
jgi:hypothetical protein